MLTTLFPSPRHTYRKADDKVLSETSFNRPWRLLCFQCSVDCNLVILLSCLPYRFRLYYAYDSILVLLLPDDKSPVLVSRSSVGQTHRVKMRLIKPPYDGEIAAASVSVMDHGNRRWPHKGLRCDGGDRRTGGVGLCRRPVRRSPDFVG